ncbi:MAG: FAD-binding oxidoreductase [Burkholderiales bacterium]|nr:FAD-binding oxidoreductase [Burkholderiales bacterium]
MRYHFAVIGAGIAGASVARRLAPAARVLLLERETQPGYHSTGRSAAIFIPTYGPPLARALTAVSRAFYDHPPAGFASRPILAPRGLLHVAGPGQESRLATTLATAAREGVEMCDIGAERAREMVPVLRPQWVRGAALEPDAMDIDVDALLQGFLRGARAAGAELVAGAEASALDRAGAGWRIATTAGVFEADVIVNAAGAWADEVARRAGLAPLGLEPRRRSAFVFAAPPGATIEHWPAVLAADESFYFKPDARQLLGSPANADPTVAQDVRPEELDIALGIDRIATATTLEIRRPARTWAGLRTFSPDGDIVIGFDPRDERFFWLAGQGGFGIQSAAAAGEVAANELVGVSLPPAIAALGVTAAALSPGRLRR